MNVTLIGMPGSGKSTIGAQLAQKLGCAFLDVDPLIEQREGDSLQAVLDRLGTERFLDVEAEVIEQLDCRDTVIAPGGSAILREKGARRLKALGPVVYLKLSCGELEKRLGNLATRGVTLAPGQSLQDLYDYRAPYYERYADFTVDTEKNGEAETVEAILAALKQL